MSSGSHRIANVNSTDVFFADYLVEQLLPVSRWSTEFYTTPLATRSEGDVFRVISSQPDTTVVVGSDALVLAEAGEVLELTLTSATKITADKPVQLLQFATSSDVDGVTSCRSIDGHWCWPGPIGRRPMPSRRRRPASPPIMRMLSRLPRLPGR